jgi:O-succinylbenzoate synthase
MASSELIDYPGDTSPNERYFSQDIVDRLFEMNDGIIKPFNSFGIGVKINESALTQFKVEEGVLS